MNIFVLDEDPIKAAQMQHDKHVVKMVLESAQLLSTVMFLEGFGSTNFYKPTHTKHPCTLWLMESSENLRWLVRHFKALLDEYTFRYDKVHKCSKILEEFDKLSGYVHYGSITMTPFVVVVPKEFKIGSAVESYKNYYKETKLSQSKYTKRENPFEIHS
jgi:hypothetical protein